jgi:hypothetical protein
MRDVLHVFVRTSHDFTSCPAPPPSTVHTSVFVVLTTFPVVLMNPVGVSTAVSQVSVNVNVPVAVIISPIWIVVLSVTTTVVHQSSTGQPSRSTPLYQYVIPDGGLGMEEKVVNRFDGVPVTIAVMIAISVTARLANAAHPTLLPPDRISFVPLSYS